MQDFRKEDLPERADAFAAEADGLAALRPHIRVPRVLDHGIRDGKAFILLERLELLRSGDWRAMGRMLAKLHRQTGPRYGWHRDNYIGLAAQANTWHDDWADFLWNCRLEPQARKSGIKLERTILEPISRRPVASLLHGDLWGGNAGFTADGPVVYDPAVYYGDREADLAMTELFGGFPREFYDAYEKEWPLDDGYHRRKHVYNLYHLLNHLNLFGSGYLGQVKATLGFLGL